MALLHLSRPAGAAASANRIGSMFMSAFGAVSAWNDARVTRTSLEALTDRELDDIGLTRADIERVARR